MLCSRRQHSQLISGSSRELGAQEMRLASCFGTQTRPGSCRTCIRALLCRMEAARLCLNLPRRKWKRDLAAVHSSFVGGCREDEVKLFRN